MRIGFTLVVRWLWIAFTGFLRFSYVLSLFRVIASAVLYAHQIRVCTSRCGGGSKGSVRAITPGRDSGLPNAGDLCSKISLEFEYAEHLTLVNKLLLLKPSRLKNSGVTPSLRVVVGTGR